MQSPYRIPIWKKAPLLRILLPLLAGILLQWYLSLAVGFLVMALLFFSLAFMLFYFLMHSLRYRLAWLQGLSLQLIIICFGCLLIWQNDSRRNPHWFGHYYQPGQVLLLQLQEPVIEKLHSYKAEAKMLALIGDTALVKCTGKFIVYFAKNDTVAHLKYGDRLLINQTLQPIKSAGNPGSFNYKRYAGFQQIHYTVYVKPHQLKLLPKNTGHWFYTFIYRARSYIIYTLQKHLKKDPSVSAIAEALLIGYKENLDRDLLQAYSNTGVVHIIAISGLHLGLIYVLLVALFNQLPFIKKSVWAKSIFIITCLWLFSLLTGASASVLRSAVMFTCIVIGKNFFSQSSVYNSLAASAVILLSYNPYLLWDVGFQLSYLAVLGIIWLQPPMYKLIYFKYKALRYVWGMVSVTIAAQMAAFPICIYYFHQFPNMFLFTNLLTVPLSEIILVSEILLMAFSWNNFLADFIGKLVSVFIQLMNRVVNFFNDFSFSVTDNLYATGVSTFILYAVIICFCCLVLYKKKYWLMFGLGFTACLAAFYFFAFTKLQQQHKIIVYNVSKYSAIDYIEKDKYFFMGDSVLMEDGLLQNFHLKPSRISLQLQAHPSQLPGVYRNGNFWQFKNMHILWLSDTAKPTQNAPNFKVDLLILSKNAKINLPQIAHQYKPAQVVIDGSNSLWKIAQWKKDCEDLHLPCFSVSTKGAFVVNLP